MEGDRRPAARPLHNRPLPARQDGRQVAFQVLKAAILKQQNKAQGPVGFVRVFRIHKKMGLDFL